MPFVWMDQVSGLMIRPVASLGKKKVDLGGMTSPARETSQTALSGVGCMMKPMRSGSSWQSRTNASSSWG